MEESVAMVIANEISTGLRTMETNRTKLLVRKFLVTFLSVKHNVSSSIRVRLLITNWSNLGWE
jgi:hypothetical protein